MGDPGIAAHMTRLESWTSRIRTWLLWKRRRLLPYLVWYGDELDVVVTLKEDRLPKGMSPDEAFGSLMRGRFHQIQNQLSEVGITFDVGQGCDGRDWEWDWSLQGPISVRFKSRATRPELRAARPRPKREAG